VEKLKDQLDLLTERLNDEGQQAISRTGISGVSVKLGETLRDLTRGPGLMTGVEQRVTDVIEGLDRTRVLNAICSGRIDEELIDDIIKRVASVQKKTAERIINKYNLNVRKVDSSV
jgi:hypothetical protein